MFFWEYFRLLYLLMSFCAGEPHTFTFTRMAGPGHQEGLGLATPGEVVELTMGGETIITNVKFVDLVVRWGEGIRGYRLSISSLGRKLVLSERSQENTWPSPLRWTSPNLPRPLRPCERVCLTPLSANPYPLLHYSQGLSF